jgi:hypothetical protein
MTLARETYQDAHPKASKPRSRKPRAQIVSKTALGKALKDANSPYTVEQVMEMLDKENRLSQSAYLQQKRSIKFARK